MTDDERTPADVLCDVLLYAPLGFAFEARRLLPELAVRGRNQVAAARFIGEFAVQRAGANLGPDVEKIGRDVSRAIETVLGGLGLNVPPLFPVAPAEDEGGAAAEAGAADASASETTTESARETDRESASTSGTALAADAGPVAGGPVEPLPAEPPVPEAEPPAPPAGDLAIPDYDSLAASQVVPRLASLDLGELEAVKAYESAARGRRTILNRVEQLLEQRRTRGH